MSYNISREFIDELSSSVSLVEVISSRLKLNKKGNSYSACCPFHNEKTPSFFVNPAKQFFYCFGCGARGDSIQFIIDFDKVTFVEAVERLASIAGLSIPASNTSPAVVEKQRKRLPILQLLANYYYENLKTSNLAINYLKSRGISGLAAKEFNLGYAKDSWSDLPVDLESVDSKNQLLELGIVGCKNNKFYNKFRHRIMFPIRNLQGKVVGFGARALDNSQQPKYLNSSESDIFHKRQTLFGLYEAKKQGLSEGLIVVEGYMDVISLYQNGITNVVATLGTALTSSHLQTMLRYSDKLVFCFDGDTAGTNAAKKALDLSLSYLSPGKEICFAIMPAGEDPDSIVQQKGANALKEYIQNAVQLGEFMFSCLQQDFDLNNSHSRVKLASAAHAMIAKIPSQIYQGMLYRQLAEVVDIDLADLREDKQSQKLFDLPNNHTYKPNKPINPSSPSAKILGILLKNRELLSDFPQEMLKLKLDLYENVDKDTICLLQVVHFLLEKQDLSLDELKSRLPINLHRSIAVALSIQNKLVLEASEQKVEFITALSWLQNYFRQQRLQMLLNKEQTSGLSEMEKQDLLKLISTKGSGFVTE